MQTTYYEGSDIDDTPIKESILAQYADFTFEDAEEILKTSTWNVNEKLPGSYVWLPHASRILYDMEEKEELDMEDFWSIVNTELEKECDRYYMEHHEAQK